MKIDGKEIAKETFEDLTKRVGELKKNGTIPHVAIILVGHDPASVAYVNQKKKRAEEIGCLTTVLNYELGIRNNELVEIIKRLNNDQQVHGIIVQRPLPEHIDSEKINLATNPKKDIDAFCQDSPFAMPIAKAVLKILENIYNQDELPTGPRDFPAWLWSKTTVVIGKGETGGGPIIAMFKKIGINPVIIDSKTKNPEEITKNADIVISTVGRENVLQGTNIKQNAIVIGVGMHKGSDGKLYPDYDENEIKNKASFYTPVPGGVGPVNVAMLLENLLQAAKSTRP